MKRVLITGAGRGLGFSLVRVCLGRGDRVFAGCRDRTASTQLDDLAAQYPHSLTILPLDVTDQESVDSSWQQVRALIDGLDLLLNNAGVNAWSKGIRDMATDQHNNRAADGCDIETVQLGALRKMLEVNAIGPLAVARRYLELLKNGVDPKIVNISSNRASLTLKTTPGNYGYCASKATLNMLMRTLAFDVARLGVTVVMMDPGWMRTDMGGPNALVTAEESAQAILQLVDRLCIADTGRFLDRQGDELPW